LTQAPTLATPPSSVRRAAADFWLNALFWQARNAPIIGKLLKPLAVQTTWKCSHLVRESTALNARRIFGPDTTDAQVRVYAKSVISSFFDFVCDVGRCVGLSDEQLVGQIESVRGEEAYVAARAAKKGAIIATAHMGSFEAAAAGLLRREKRIHVVFKRDQHNLFETVRSDLRRRLGVIEAPVDDGLSVWFHLREALQRDEVVMLQADRTMPGQKGTSVPFLHGHMTLPTGPIKLALASGAPVIPIFALRTPSGRVSINIEPAIEVEHSGERIHPALFQLARILESYVRDHPEQWLTLHRAFSEDSTPSQEALA
jgi:KDO2-lipid IV(A) lauroyltransferase